MVESNEIKLEQRRLFTSRAQKNILGLAENFEEVRVHKNYLNGLGQDEFISGLNSLALTLKALYTGIINEPQTYAVKNADDVKGLSKNTNFLLLLAQNGVLKGNLLEVDGKRFAEVLKDAKVTKPEIYFKSYELLGFVISGFKKKIETSENITVEFPDNNYLITALKAIADAVGAFSTGKPHQSNLYFELLDHRILENYPSTEPKLTMEYIISKLSIGSCDVVKKFHKFITPFAKCEIKGNIGHYWTLTYSLKSTKKVIMSLKLDLESHDVKLNLANVVKYAVILDDFPSKMISEIKDGGWDCGNCKSKSDECAFAFDLDNKSYKKCRCGSFIFVKPDGNDSELLLRLLRKEIEFL